MISHFITELVKEYQTSRPGCQPSELLVALQVGFEIFLINQIFFPYSGQHPGLGGHLDPATAAQYSHLVAGAGNGYEVYKGRDSYKHSYCPHYSLTDHAPDPHTHSNGVSIF